MGNANEENQMKMCCWVAFVGTCAAGCSRTPNKHKPVHVDIYALAADPSALMGERVQVQGYYDDSFESQVLTPTGMRGPGPSVWIEARAPASLHREALRYAGTIGQVVVEGTVAASSGRSCALVDSVVLRFIPVNTTTPPEFREFVNATHQLSSSGVEERGQARTWLVEFAGEDVGDTRSAWMAWWRENRHEAYARTVYLAIEQIMFACDAANKDTHLPDGLRRGPFRGVPEEFPEIPLSDVGPDTP